MFSHLSSLKQHASGFSWLVTKNVLIAASSFGVTYVAANYLDANVFGIYKYIISITALVAIFSLTGAQQALVRTLAATNYNPLKKLSRARLKFSIPGAIFLLLLALYYFLQDNSIFAFSFAMAAIAMPLQAFGSISIHSFNGLRKYDTYSLLNIFSSVSISFATAFTMFLSQSVLVIVAVYFTLSSVVSYLIYKYTTWKIKIPSQTPVDEESLTLSKQLSFVNVAKKIADQADVLIAFQFAGPIATASYAVSKAPVQILLSQGGIISAMTLPRFSQYKKGVVKEKIHIKAIFLLTLTATATIVYLLLSPYIFSAMFPNYSDVVIYTQILSVSLLGLPQLLFYEALLAEKSIKKIYIIDTLLPIINVILLLLLTLKLGTLGLATAFTAAYLLRAVSLVFLYYK